MKIAIDARGINWYKGTGIGTYTDRILNYMIKIIMKTFIIYIGQGKDMIILTKKYQYNNGI
jgi:hypothetical protein